MKKSLLALAALAATSGAFAQSSVTLYGVADLGVAQVKVKDTSSLFGGTPGAPIDNTNPEMKSVLSGSRIGFRGVEDLGAGLKANFLMEYGVTPDEASTPMNNRQGYAGLSGAFGEFRLGRQYTPFHVVQGAVDFLGNMDSPGYLPVLLSRTRASNAFQYTTPNLGGLSATLQYNGDKKNNTQGYGLNVIYGNGPLTVAGTYDKSQPDGILPGAKSDLKPVGGLAAVTTGSNVKTWAVGGAYNFGVAAVSLAYANQKAQALGVVGDASVRGWNVGAMAPLGAIVLAANVGKASGKDGLNNLKATGYQLGANYSLSNRTTAYLNYGALKVTFPGGEMTKKQPAIGLRHTF